jgi:hypothetical protein
VNGQAEYMKWNFITTKLEWESLIVKLLRNNASLINVATLEQPLPLHVISIIGLSHVCYCPDIIVAAKLLSKFYKDETIGMSQLKAIESIGVSFYQQIDKYAKHRPDTFPLIFGINFTPSFAEIIKRYGLVEVGHNDLRFLHKNWPLSQDLILRKVNKITYMIGGKKTRHCAKHGMDVHPIREHDTKFVTKSKKKPAAISHYKGQRGIFTTFNAMLWNPKHYKHYLPYIKDIMLTMSIIMRFKKVIVDVFPRDLLYIIFKFLLIAEYQDVTDARIKKNFYHLDYCDECSGIDTLIGTKCIRFSKIKPVTENHNTCVAWPGDENEGDEDEEEIKKIRAKLAEGN